MSWPKKPGANGMTSRVITDARYVTTGAHVKTIGSAPVGVKSSFMRTLSPWTTDRADPAGPTRSGPRRRFISAMIFISM